jgi:hypothetical protein
MDHVSGSEGDRMRHVPVDTWVVYQRPMRGCAEGIRAVCEQREWAAMNLAKPGFYTLIQEHIENEGKAEQLARGKSGQELSPAAKRELVVSSLPD